ncbi:MAG: hexose kinase [Anaerolineaceae bacterium]|nr:hexose kinase [Anaerolineaceae bacterium]
MILTVTPNSAVDWTVSIPHFHWEQPLRANSAVWGVAGRPASAAWILGELGIIATAMGFVAGTSGEKLIELLEAKNVETDFTWVGGETRLNVHIVNQQTGEQTLLAVDTLEITNTQRERFTRRFHKKLAHADALVIGSSLPASIDPDFFNNLITAAKEMDVPVVLDTCSPHLAHALLAAPTVIKPNRTELSSVAGEHITTIEQAYRVARAILDQTGTQVIVTLDTDGTLAVLKESAFRIPAPVLTAIESTAGAGAGVLAGIAYALANSLPIQEGIRLGTAAAGAVILTPATADCRKEDVELLLPTIELIPYP